jgi:hypothetical protein
MAIALGSPGSAPAFVANFCVRPAASTITESPLKTIFATCSGASSIVADAAKTLSVIDVRVLPAPSSAL